MAFSQSFEIGNNTLKIIERAADTQISKNEDIFEVVNKSSSKTSKKSFIEETTLIADFENYSDFFKSNISFKENYASKINFSENKTCSDICLKTNIDENINKMLTYKIESEDLDIFLDSFQCNLDNVDVDVVSDGSLDCEILHATQNPGFIFIKPNSQESAKILADELENGKINLSIMAEEEEHNFVQNLTSNFENLSTSEKPLLQLSISSESIDEDDLKEKRYIECKYLQNEANFESTAKLLENKSVLESSKLTSSLSEEKLFVEEPEKENEKAKMSKLNCSIYPNIKLNHISNWNLPATILEEYTRKGVVTLFDWQIECLNNARILFDYENLVYSAPTSAGKTLISEIIAIKNILERKKKVIFILPFVSVVREKTSYLQDLLCSSGYRVEGFFGGYSPAGGFDSINLAVCTIEKANSIVNRLLEQGKLDNLGCVIIDEIHLITDPGRGYILELLLTKILYMSKKFDNKIQIVTMSATLPNCEILKKWLNAELYITDFRPVELKEMVKIDQKIYDNKLKLIRTIDYASIPEIQNDQDEIALLCLETLLEGCSVIIFCPSKDWCENLSQNLSRTIKQLYNSSTEVGLNLQKVIKKDNLLKVKDQLKALHSGCDKFLESTCEYGCAFHHAGLTTEERDVVEANFKKGFLKIIVATSTLSSGVNLPARRVIIRSPLFGGKIMDSLTYKQMIGRAGRTGKDTLGESILICNANNAKFGKELLQSSLKPISSCLGYDKGQHLRRALLEVISSGVAKTTLELHTFLSCTLFSATREEVYLSDGTAKVTQKFDALEESLNFLTEFEFIRMQKDNTTGNIIYVPSRLGMACLVSSLPPTDGIILFSELQRSRKCFVLESELHAVYLVTPYSVCYQLQNLDWLHYLDLWEQLPPGMKKVAEIVGVKESFLVRAMRSQNKLDIKLLQIHKRFYIALALQELVNEVSISVVAFKYKCSRGLLQSLQQMSSTFASIVTSFCNALNWKTLGLIVSQFKERLYFGVHRDLIDLMKLPDLNGYKARALFNAGIESLIDLANSNVFVIEKILYDSLSFESNKKQDGENEIEAQKRYAIRKLYITGKINLTIKQTAEMLIKNAQKFLQYEIGVDCNWNNNRNYDNITIKETFAEADNLFQKSSEVPSNVRSFDSNVIEESSDKNLNKSEINPGIQTNNNQLSNYLNQNSCKKINRKGFLQVNSNNNFNQFDISKACFPPEKITNESFVDISKTSNVSIVKDPNLLNNLHTGTTIDDGNLKKKICIIDLSHDAESQRNHLENIFKAQKIGFSIGIEKLPPGKKNKPIIGSNILPMAVLQAPVDNNETFVIEDKYFIAGISISYEDDSALFINFKTTEKENIFQSKINFLKDVISNEEITLRIYNSKEHIKILQKYVLKDFKLRNRTEDPKIANWLLDPDGEISISKLISEYLPQYASLLEHIAHYKGCLSLGLNYNLQISAKKRASYEACFTRNIFENQLKVLENFAEGQMKKFFYELEMPIQRVLADAEIIGISISSTKTQQLINKLFETMKNLESKIFYLHGSSFNLRSSSAVAKVLGLHKKINGKLSTSKQILEKIDSPMSNLILNYRKIFTILTKNIQPLQKVIQNNRIYGNSITTSSTGRISMNEPNVQNIAKDFEISLDDKIVRISCRSIFLCSEGRCLLSADFCQLEMRILTHLSQDEGLKIAINSDKDIFTVIAARWNSVKEEAISDQVRNGTKQLCYGIIYGMGIKALSENLKCTETEASSMLEQFHMTFPGIRAYISKVIKFARQNCYVETITGRRRYLTNINSNDNANKSQAERQSVNSTIQGSAADIAKSAILRMEKNIIKYKSKLGVNIPNEVKSQVDLVLHLHDELIFELPEDKVRNVAKVLKATMENCVKLSVPLKVKLKAGRSWGEMTVLSL